MTPNSRPIDLHLSHVACFPRYDLLFQKAPAVKRTNARMIPAITSRTVITTSRFSFFASRERSVIQRKLTGWNPLSASSSATRKTYSPPLPKDRKGVGRVAVLLPNPLLSYSSMMSKRQMQTFASHRIVSVPLISLYFPVPPVIAPTEKPMTGANPCSSVNGACP